MLRDVVLFNRRATEDVENHFANLDSHISLGDYLRAGGYGEEFLHDYILVSTQNCYRVVCLLTVHGSLWPDASVRSNNEPLAKESITHFRSREYTAERLRFRLSSKKPTSIYV